MIVNFIMGKDMNADMLSYHVYSAHMFWTGGYREEFMGAGLQSFLNPLGYLPFYALLQAGLPSIVVASCMASLHALNLYFIWLIGRDHLFRDADRPGSYALLGTALAGISPVFLAVLGSSFLDPVQSAMLLAGLYCLMQGLNQPRRIRLMLLAGLLMGVAAGLKPTIVTVPALAFMALAIVSWPLSLTAITRQHLLPFAGGVAAGGLATGGHWALHLWQRFGNPVFPFANDLFNSPDFFALTLTTDRYASEGWLDVFAFPFRMAKINSGIYVEIAAPDIRFALIALLMVGMGVWSLRGKWNKGFPPGPASPGSTGAVKLLWIVFIAGVLLWMAKLGNGRYHLIYLLLAGPLLLWLMTRCWGIRKGVLLGGGLILAAQFAHGLSMGYPRWDTAAWSDAWIKTEWPAGLEKRPATFLQVGPGIDSMVFTGFPRGSRFVDLGGKFPVAPDSPPGRRIAGMASETSPPRFVVFKSRASDAALRGQLREMTDSSMDQINHLLSPWNLKLVDGKCHPYEVEIDREEVADGKGGRQTLGIKHYALMLCPVGAGSMTTPEIEQARSRMARLAESLAASCPLLFPRPASLPTQLAGVWNVRFVGADTLLSLHQGHLTFSRYPFGPFNQPIEPDPATGLPVVKCVAPRRAW